MIITFPKWKGFLFPWKPVEINYSIQSIAGIALQQNNLDIFLPGIPFGIRPIMEIKRKDITDACFIVLAWLVAILVLIMIIGKARLLFH